MTAGSPLRMPRRPRSGPVWSRWIRGAVSYLLLGLGLTLAAFPLYWLLVNALQDPSLRFEYPPSILPKRPTLDAFAGVFERTDIAKWLLNTTIVAGATTGLTLLIGSTGAYALSRFPSRRITVAGFAILITQMMPPVILMIPLYRILLTLNLNDSYAGLVVANFVFLIPVVTWLLKSMFDAVPRDLEQAALVDGANRLQVISRITMPLALPGLIASGVFAFIESWQEFVFARALIRNDDLWVGSLGIASFFGFRTTPWNDVMVAALVFALPPLLLFLVFQRYFVAGLTGGVKG